MKLIKLKVNSSFRGLKRGFKVDFIRNEDQNSFWNFNPYCLVGKNGSGKSNVLEALASIFYHLECMYLETIPDGFMKDETLADYCFDPEKSYPDAFELEYYIPSPIPYTNSKGHEVLADPTLAHVKIKKVANKRPIITWKNQSEFFNGRLTRKIIKQLLPEYIIGYSSGENEILSLPFFKMRFIHFDEYLYRLKGQFDYERPEGRFIYADSSYSQAIFLTNYLMQEEQVLSPFFHVLGVKSLDQFRIIMRRNEKVPQFSLDEDDSIEFQSLSERDNNFLEITSLLKSIIDKLISCSTTHYEDENGDLYLDYWVDNHTRFAFRRNFDNDPISLFHSLQILLTLNLFEISSDLKNEVYVSDSLYVNETIPALASDRRIMRFKNFEIEKKKSGTLLSKSFSDGEHQYLHAIGICLLFKDSNCLFLLDEPETHLNPQWRAKFISVLRECLREREEPVLQDLLITTHSPFIVSDCRREHVLVFENGKVDNPKIKTFGTSVNLLTVELFDKIETISEISMERLSKYYERFTEGEEVETIIMEMNEELGDSVEKIMMINKILEENK